MQKYLSDGGVHRRMELSFEAAYLISISSVEQRWQINLITGGASIDIDRLCHSNRRQIWGEQLSMHNRYPRRQEKLLSEKENSDWKV